jgi:manganese oxidase
MKSAFHLIGVFVAGVVYPSALLEAQPAAQCSRTLYANVVALDQPLMMNRLGSEIPGGMIFALARDVVDSNGATNPPASCDNGSCKAGQVSLRQSKRPRPIVLRMGVGDCLVVNFTNLVTPSPTHDQLQFFVPANGSQPAIGQLYGESLTRAVGFHPAGLDQVTQSGPQPSPTPTGCSPMPGDANVVGRNCSSWAYPGETRVYKYYAKAEGHYLVYSNDDAQGATGVAANAGQQESGLFGSVTVEPGGAEFYRSQVTKRDLEDATFAACGGTRTTDCVSDHFGGPIPNMRIDPLYDASGKQQVRTIDGVPLPLWTLTTRNTLEQAKTDLTATVVKRNGNRLHSVDDHPVVNYSAVYQTADNDVQQPAGTPVLSMLQPILVANRAARGGATLEIVASDLTGIITGPGAGRFPDYQDSPLFAENPALPDRREPFREFTIHYHVSNAVVQPFAAFSEGPLKTMLNPGQDGFGINYGMAAIGPEVLANRLKVGPEAPCVECKFEEFFLTSWVVGDPAMLVDVPTGGNKSGLPANAASLRQVLSGQSDPSSHSKIALTGYRGVVVPESMKAEPAATKATKAFFPDDPSNVYHSYMRDHVKFRISNVSVGQPHVHHQHAHQWLQTPNSDNAQYLDSQMIVPGSTYTLEMVYNGSGNRNQTVGDSIFHCHFYPHFAAGMWSLWRVHDVFEEGTQLNKDGSVAKVEWNRALPDGEIETGTPIPALVPVPTLGMAPYPAKIELVDKGTRAVVKADSPGVYRNPGFPFFVPGVAGHRAPHPPMDFAWEETAPGVPKLDANHRKDYLDGGLPRHLILGGKIVRELHTRWDFTKDTIARDKTGKVVAGGLTAFVLPEEGTDIERAAMAAHSRRTYATFQPDGQPGAFILNGLPSAPGAPYARPDIDDNGNAVTNKRRYQAAVIQTDVVLNKDGWHYPQQRLLTLWNDVKPTLSGDRPAEPLFFRANSGDTVEYWHTNLVPSYYELDDFQVRTPTDIIGQHIHLVKFDVTSSDGASNGFNYEDGTFSPDEVRDRIDAINLSKGLFEGPQNPVSGNYPRIETCLNGKAPLLACLSTVPRHILTIKKPNPIWGPPPLGTSWDGAQTTIQLWQADPLLNNNGRDRSLRTVFTHDHFGPSTHQNVGLYAGLVVEPAGSTWSEPTTGQSMYDLSTRSDGGPTSWQADIKTKTTADSYREFVLEFQDLQLAYSPQSRSTAKAPTAPLFVQSETEQQFTNDVNTLNNSHTLPDSLFPVFKANGIILLPGAKAAACPGFTWCITDAAFPGYTFGLTSIPAQFSFEAFTPDMPAGWADTPNALAPPGSDPYPSNVSGPFPLLIDSSPGTGTYSLNYRNEPVPLRANTNTPSGVAGSSGRQTDLAWSFASLSNRNDPKLNAQPESCTPKPACLNINGTSSGFAWPKVPLSPGMTGPDPYTPLLRAYENDRVQIRTLVGAHVTTHAFMLHGLNWLYEPQYGNSGFKSLQGMGLSEHFEMLFRMPAPVKLPGATFSDYLYAPSSGVSGITQGLWGLLRAYDGSTGLQPALQPLPNNPQGHARNATIGTCPANAAPRPYTVWATTPQQLGPLGANGLTYNTRGATSNGLTAPNALVYVDVANLNSDGTLKAEFKSIEPLILRARAGECVQITLVNKLPLNTSPATNPLGGPFTNSNAPFRFHVDTADLASLNGATVPAAVTQAFALNGYPLTSPSVTVTTAWTNWTLTSGSASYGLTVAADVMSVSNAPLPAVSVNPSITAGLHSPELSYNIRLGDGANVGYNQIGSSSVADTAGANGGAVQLQWYAGNIAEGPNGNVVTTPVEFGSIPLLPADPLFQAANGMIGALVVEPENASWTADPGTLAAATVSIPGGRPFREFVTLLQSNVAGLNGTVGAGGNTVGYTANSGVNYKSEPAGLRVPPNAGAFQIVTGALASYVKPLDACVEGSVAGCLANSALQGQFKAPFLNESAPFTLIPGATSEVKAGTWQIQSGSNTYTVSYTGGRLSVSNGTTTVVSINATPALVEALDGVGVSADLSALFNAVQPPIPSGATVTVTGSRGWTITDGIYVFTVLAVINSGKITLPLSVTYTINTASNPVLIDYSKFLSNFNSPQPQPPQTPTFCASAGQPVRFRVVQPGADTDQMVEIHGHSWQQEPYTRGGLGIGNNPSSQQLGTQVISANDRLDIVLDSAGGAFQVPGDYLYHSFMNQLAGMWGLFRVLPAGQNPVTNCQAGSPSATSGH